MDTRQASPRIPTPRSYDEIQHYLAGHSQTFITYLKELANALNHIGEAFDNHGRLFFKNSLITSPELVDRIHDIVNNKNLLLHFEKRLKFWKPFFDMDSISTVRRFFFDYYFLPIEQSDEYKIFMLEQAIKIKNATKDSSTETNIKHINNMIGGAILFRIIAAWKELHPDLLTEKLKLLAKILNSTMDVASLTESFRRQLINNIDNLFIRLQLCLDDGDLNENKINEEIAKIIKDIHHDFYFEGFKDEGQNILTQRLNEIFCKLSSHHHFYAKALFDYCKNNFYPENKYIIALTQLIVPHLSESIIKKNPDIFKNMDVCTRSSSAPTLRAKKSSGFFGSLLRSSTKSHAQKRLTDSNPSSEVIAEKSISTTHASPRGFPDAPSLAPSLFRDERPRRIQVKQMRRRASSASVLTSPRKNINSPTVNALISPRNESEAPTLTAKPRLDPA